MQKLPLASESSAKAANPFAGPNWDIILGEAAASAVAHADPRSVYRSNGVLLPLYRKLNTTLDGIFAKANDRARVLQVARQSVASRGCNDPSDLLGQAFALAEAKAKP